MDVYQLGSSWWIRLTVTDFEKTMEKRAGGTNPTAPPLSVVFTFSGAAGLNSAQ